MDSSESGSQRAKLFRRIELYLLMKRSNKPSFQEKLDFMEQEVVKSYENSNHAIKSDVKLKLSGLKHQFKQKWMAARKTSARFEKTNVDWLNGEVQFPCPGNSPGRPKKPFADASERSKRRKTTDLRTKDASELIFATHMKLRETGKGDAAKVVKDLTKSPTRAHKYRKAIEKASSSIKSKLSPIEALSMLTEAGLTRSQYEIIRTTNKDFFPTYKSLQKIKNDCYPKPESYRVTSTCAEVELQALLDHTATRLVMDLEEAINNLNDREKKSLFLVSKWGCDGSQQAQFKMKFDNDGDSDANIFQSSFVPLQLVAGKNKKIVWQNPLPSSPRYCRPIRLRFIKESNDITNEEINYIKSKINNLLPTKFKNTSIKHKMLFTMVDGKVCNAATHTKYSMRCYICNATSKEFNDLGKKRDTVKENLSFGLSLLHARIRFFESMLHVAYKLPVRKWNVKLTKNENEKVQEKKRKIQEDFKQQTGLLVDIPKSNFGNTNDGNTSRRFFENYELSAEITGLDKDLLYRLKVILDTLCCGHDIDVNKFEKYAQETAELYVKLYDFYPMSPTLHKILAHGAEVIKEAILPIGLLSEEAAEARNKHIRSYRLSYARKYSREACNRDVINRLLLTSDPVITGMRKHIRKNTKPFNNDVLSLLLAGNPDNSNQSLIVDDDIDNDESCDDN